MVKMLINGVVGIVALGFIVAIGQAFGGDPFAVIEWLVGRGLDMIGAIADWFSSNETFKDVTKEPA